MPKSPGRWRCPSRSKPLPGTGRTHVGCTGAKRPGKTRPNPLRGRAAAGKIPQKRAKMGGKSVSRQSGEALGWRGCTPRHQPLQPPSLPKPLLHLESPKERNEKVKRRQMQSTDKKYQGANRLCFFMPKIFAFLFLPWRHKPLLLSHNHSHCRCQEELQRGEGDPFPRKSLCNGGSARGAQTRWSPGSRTRERHNPSEEGVSRGEGAIGAPQGHAGRSPHHSAPGFELVEDGTARGEAAETSRRGQQGQVQGPARGEEQSQAPVQVGADLLESSSAERDWECWGTTG